MEKSVINLEFEEKKISKIIIENKSFDKIPYLLKDKFNFIIIITNPTIEALYGNKLKERLEDVGLKVRLFNIPDSEKAKDITQIINLYKNLSELQLSRKDTVVLTLGGGVVGDTGGFVAATFLRGLNFVQVPTTLLAQVDSSIGGKVGINTEYAKNLIGAFYQPQLIIIDPYILHTLPEENFKEGLSEVIKYGIIENTALGYSPKNSLFEYLEKNIFSLLEKEEDILKEVILRCCRIKAKVVQEDEKETKGFRWLLNFGHTFSHGIEQATNYEYSHGKALALGILSACRLSLSLKILDSKQDYLRIKNLIKIVGLPTKLSKNIEKDKIYQSMLFDKKKGESLRFILIKKIGEVVIKEKIDKLKIISALENNFI